MAPAPAHDGLRVLRTARVTPFAPGGSALPERALPLTYKDAIWLRSNPVERVFLYRLDPAATASNVAGVLSKLTDSLSRTLTAFYPLAGRVRLTPGETNRYELFYQPGDGVALTVAELDGVGVEDLANDDPREVAKIASLVPTLPEGGAVLALQATVLLPAARRGLALALGVTVHHAACDGASSTHFIHAWAATCAGAHAPAPEPPVIDRTLIRNRDDIYDRVTAPWPGDDDGGKKNLFESPDVGEKLLATFTLSRERLQSVKDAVAAEAAHRGVAPPRCTSIIATFAVMWQCHYRSEQGSTEAAAHGGSAHLNFLMDQRARLEPRVPDKYLGNCVGPCLVSAPKEELAAAGADGLFAACAAVAASIDEATRLGAGYWDVWEGRIAELIKGGGSLLTVAGSPRFRVYDVDFGFGKPAKVDIVSVAKTGAVAVAESRDGSGGIEACIGLPLERMQRFQRCFAETIA